MAVTYSGSIVHSTDGDRWTEASAVAPEQLRDVAYGSNRFVAVGVAAGDEFQLGTILHSVDGDQWTTASDTAITYWFFRVAHGGTHFIAIAWNNDPRSSKIVRSADGITWKEASDTDISGYLQDVAYGADRFVAVGESGKIIHSPTATAGPRPALPLRRKVFRE